MKKVNYFFVLLCVACVFGSCAVGSYVPSTLNVGGISTQVVLSQANYRIVRNVEAVIDINNDNLRRADVEKSAFAELMRRYPLTGSQAYINVVLEEVRREKFGMGGGLQKRYQHVAIRATIIEFLLSEGNPIQFQYSESAYNTAPQREVKSEPQKTENKIAQTETALSSEQQALANKYYIAWLSKTGHLSFDKQKQKELYQLFDKKEIDTLKTQNTTNGLEHSMKGYDKKLERFAK